MKNLFLQLPGDHETLVSCQIEQAPLNDLILFFIESTFFKIPLKLNYFTRSCRNVLFTFRFASICSDNIIQK